LNTPIIDLSPRRAALTAAIGLLLMAIIAPFAEFYVMDSLIVDGEAATTASNILAQETLFRIGGLSYIVVAVLDVLVAWALYLFLRPASESLALLAGWFRLIYSGMFALAANDLFNVLNVLRSGEAVGLSAEQANAQAMLALDSFNSGWDIGLIVFGMHLVFVGLVILRADFMPSWLGILVLIAGLGYMIDSFGVLLSPDYTMVISLVTFVGEVILIFWLFIRGGRNQPALTTA